MKKFLSAIILTGAFVYADAQQYLVGRLTDKQERTQFINYDRTENSIGSYIYQSEYKVLSKNNTLLYTITVTHDQLRSLFSVALKTEDADVKGAIIEYDENECGLIFDDHSNMDTVFDMLQPYKYLISFTDVNRDYPVLNKIKTGTGEEIALDPLNKFCLKRHLEIVKSRRVREYVAQKGGKTSDDKSDADGFTYKGDLWGDKNADVNKKRSAFASQMLKARDSLYMRSNLYNAAVAQLHTSIEKNIQAAFKNSHPRDNVKKYQGEKKKGKPEGNGILLDDGAVYDGKFEQGVFLSGNVIFKEDSGEYCGQYSNDYKNGTGVVKYKGGDYLLGKFKNGRLSDGIMLAKDKDGEMFFGNCAYNQRTGYGELRSPGGTCYYGVFKKGRLVKGYAKEVDQFGYATYSKIDNGVKKTIDPQQARDFFGEALSYKK